MTTIKPIADYLKLPLDSLLGAEPPQAAASVTAPPANMARRFRAIRRGVWPKASEAAQALRISERQLEQIEDGEQEPSRELLYDFCDRTGATLDFMERGKSEHLRLALAVWLAQHYPDLVPALMDRRG